MAEEKVEEFVMILWSLWKARNLLVFERKTQAVDMVLMQAMSFLSDYRKVYEATTQEVDNGDNKEGKWQRLESGRFKVNVDEAIAKDKSGIGVIIRDDKGEVIACMACLVYYV